MVFFIVIASILGGGLGLWILIRLIFFTLDEFERKGYSSGVVSLFSIFFFPLSLLIALMIHPTNSAQPKSRTLKNKLDELDALLADKRITKKEYDTARTKVLNGE